MKFSIVSAIAALAASVAAVPAFTNTNFDVKAGSTFTLTWANATGPVTLTLLTGPSTDLSKVDTIKSAVTGASYTWTVPTTLVTGTYAFEISDSAGINYSKQFALTGTGVSASASASSAASTAASSADSSASTGSASATSSSASESASSDASSASSSSSSSSSATAHTTSKSASTTATKTTATSTRASASATATPTSTVTPANTNNAPQAKSPLAFILVTVAALLYFN